jgi:hypothetical protein
MVYEVVVIADIPSGFRPGWLVADLRMPQFGPLDVVGPGRRANECVLRGFSRLHSRDPAIILRVEPDQRVGLARAAGVS